RHHLRGASESSGSGNTYGRRAQAGCAAAHPSLLCTGMLPSSTLDLEEMEIPLKELHISGGPIQQRECQPAGSVQNSDLPDQVLT
ncbi:MAG: hypothetical protein MKZ95_15670, partial [Pirellulales bacterium]|nr:hypothetical protein [Pirellulales bacterium]